MGKPTKQELEHALAEAARLREQGLDEHCLGKTLLNHHYRLGLLEEVLSKARQYLHSGESAQSHRALLAAIERAERASQEVV